MDDTIALWRAAMKDENHPRHKAAWVLFAPIASAKAAARILQDQSIEVVPWLHEVLDTPEFYEESSPGKGIAPIHAVGILGEWQVTETIPRLLNIIEQHDWEDQVFDEAIVALQKMGPDVLEAVLTLAEQIDRDKLVDLTAVVCRVGQDDERAFEFLCHVFEHERDDVLQSYVVGNLYEYDQERVRSYFQQYLRRAKAGPKTRAAIDDPQP